MALSVTSTLNREAVESLVMDIAATALSEPGLTPRPIAEISAAAARGDLVVLHDDNVVAGWGVRETLRPGLKEIGLLYVKPTFRSPSAFMLLARELAAAPDALVLATYEPALVRLAITEFEFGPATLGQVVAKSRGQFLVKRLSRDSRRAVRDHTRNAKPLFAIRGKR